jgi:hypothetical protein
MKATTVLQTGLGYLGHAEPESVTNLAFLTGWLENSKEIIAEGTVSFSYPPP